MFADVAIPKSSPDALTYRVPEELLPFAVPGVRVRVPIRKTFATGVIVGLETTVDIPTESIRAIEEVLDEAPLLPQRLMDIAEFISSYYRCPLGTTLASMIPARLFRPDAEEVQLTPTGAAIDPEGLSESQRSILTALHENPRLKVPTLLARAGQTGRGPPRNHGRRRVDSTPTPAARSRAAGRGHGGRASSRAPRGPARTVQTRPATTAGSRVAFVGEPAGVGE